MHHVLKIHQPYKESCLLRSILSLSWGLMWWFITAILHNHCTCVGSLCNHVYLMLGELKNVHWSLLSSQQTESLHPSVTISSEQHVPVTLILLGCEWCGCSHWPAGNSYSRILRCGYDSTGWPLLTQLAMTICWRWDLGSLEQQTHCIFVKSAVRVWAPVNWDFFRVYQVKSKDGISFRDKALDMTNSKETRGTISPE